MSLVRLELPSRQLRGKQSIDFFQTGTFELRHTEPHPYGTDERETSPDIAQFRTEVCA